MTEFKGELPKVTPDDIRMVDARDGIESRDDPMHKLWFADLLISNPDLAREILRKAHNYAGGDPVLQDRFLKIVSYTIACLESAAQRIDQIGPGDGQ